MTGPRGTMRNRLRRRVSVWTLAASPARWASVPLALALLACSPGERVTGEAKIVPVGHVVHAREGVNCAQCHGDVEVPNADGKPHLPDQAVCESCHTDDHRHPGQPCAPCHIEPETPAALAAVAESLQFDHAQHREASRGQCLTCHRGAVEADAGPPLPGMATCATCHQPWLDDLACEACHTSLSRYPLVPVTHQAHRADFLRRHASESRLDDQRCATCHAQSFCADCHDQKAPFTSDVAWPDRTDRAFIHRPAYLERHAAEARLDPRSCLSCHSEQSCSTCHEAVGRGPGGLSPHPSGWASIGAGGNDHGAAARRDLLTCAACHGGDGADLCITCHAPGRPGGSPHGGRDVHGDPRDQPCRRCHGGAP